MTTSSSPSDAPEPQTVPFAVRSRVTAAHLADEAAVVLERMRSAAEDADAQCRNLIAREPVKAVALAAGLGAVLTTLVLQLVRWKIRAR
ncbi:MAG: hypothetical protein WBH52_28590 [Pseudomonas aeruginosa]